MTRSRKPPDDEAPKEKNGDPIPQDSENDKGNGKPIPSTITIVFPMPGASCPVESIVACSSFPRAKSSAEAVIHTFVVDAEDVEAHRRILAMPIAIRIVIARFIIIPPQTA